MFAALVVVCAATATEIVFLKLRAAVDGWRAAVDAEWRRVAALEVPTDEQIQAFYLAVWEGDASAVEVMLINNIRLVNIDLDDNESPLFTAIHQGYDQIVKLLLAAGANPDKVNAWGQTPLHEAREKDFVQIMQLLLSGGADPNKGDSDGRTPLFNAALYGQDRIVKLLLDSGADPNKGAPSGGRPLYIAIVNGRTEIVKLLLAARAVCGVAGGGAAHAAELVAANTGIDCSELLKECVNVSRARPTLTGEAAASWPHYIPSLVLAAQYCHYSIVEFLLKSGADINKADSNGTTPLKGAIHKGHDRIVQLLLDSGADINKADRNGMTPLEGAIHKGHDRIVQLLLDSGADINKADNDGVTPLFNAALNGHDRIVQLLLDSGAVRDKADNDGWEPLSAAAALGHEACVKLLLDAGADKDKTNDNGMTPLYAAALMGSDACVKLLLDAGADADKANENGWTPMMGAANEGHDKVVKLIKEYIRQRIIFDSAMHTASVAEAKDMNRDEAFLLFKETVKENMGDAGYSNFDVNSKNAHAKLYKYFKGIMRSINTRP